MSWAYVDQEGEVQETSFLGCTVGPAGELILAAAPTHGPRAGELFPCMFVAPGCWSTAIWNSPPPTEEAAPELPELTPAEREAVAAYGAETRTAVAAKPMTDAARAAVR